ncbi:MAG: hypothetical protein NVS2B7_10800 [Herpetosiphon sp.]
MFAASPDPHALALCQITGLAAGELLALVATFGSAAGVLAASSTDLKTAGLSPPVAARVLAAARQVATVAPALRGLARLAITPIPIVSELFPARLLKTASPPSIIYVLGRWPPPDPLIAVVGGANLPDPRRAELRSWLADLPAAGIYPAATTALDLLPPAGVCIVVPFGLILAHQRLPPDLHAAARAGHSTVLSAVPVNAPPDAASAATTEALLLALAAARLAVDPDAAASVAALPTVELAAQPEPPGRHKRITLDPRGAAALAHLVGVHLVGADTVQQQRLW